jgi:transposase
VAEGLSDDELEARLYRPALARSSHQLAPDFEVVHQELKRPGVTLMLLWEEYATGNPLAYKYTSFCVKYLEFAKTQARSMRQVHMAGEKVFVDYAGDTVAIVDAATGEITQAQIFVAVLGASVDSIGRRNTNHEGECCDDDKETWALRSRCSTPSWISGTTKRGAAPDGCGVVAVRRDEDDR